MASLKNLGGEGAEMAAAAVLSTGPTKDLESCRADVLTFLQVLSWYIAAVEVNVWTSEGSSLGHRKWAGTADLRGLAEQIAQFITGSAVEVGATVLVRRGAV